MRARWRGVYAVTYDAKGRTQHAEELPVEVLGAEHRVDTQTRLLSAVELSRTVIRLLPEGPATVSILQRDVSVQE